jgi:glycosyltransferase involved in cell wall biosynthesis
VPILQGADVFALLPVVTADGDRDGVPNVLVEAMACGLPVLTTSTGGISDLVQDGVNGSVVSPADPVAAARALNRLLDEAEVRVRFGKAARATVEADFDRRAAARRLLALFRQAA